MPEDTPAVVGGPRSTQHLGASSLTARSRLSYQRVRKVANGSSLLSQLEHPIARRRRPFSDQRKRSERPQSRCKGTRADASQFAALIDGWTAPSPNARPVGTPSNVMVKLQLHQPGRSAPLGSLLPSCHIVEAWLPERNLAMAGCLAAPRPSTPVHGH